MRDHSPTLRRLSLAAPLVLLAVVACQGPTTPGQTGIKVSPAPGGTAAALPTKPLTSPPTNATSTTAATTLPLATPTTTTAPTTPPVAIATPGSTAQPTTPATPYLPPDTIRLLQPTGGSATFSTLPGKKLLLVASAAATGSLATPLQFAVSGDATATDVPATYRHLSLPATPEMPYRATFSQSRAGLNESQPRHLLQATAAPARTLGSEDKFWINTGNSDSASDREQTCVLKRISEHALFYIDKQAKIISDENLDRLVSEWETNIHPRVTAVFGNEPRPGIDGESRVFIVLSPAVDNFGAERGLMGYFWSRDAVPGSSSPHSNQKEALFMTDQLFDRPPLTSFGTLAHEFQHLVNFGQKAGRLRYRLAEDTWLDEGMSMYAMEVAGYGLPQGDYHIAKDLRGFEDNPDQYSLTDWAANPNGFAYGQSYLYVRYSVDRFGPGIIQEILNDDHAGVACMDSVLAKHNSDFAEHFRSWAIANAISGEPLAAGTIYNYKNLALTGRYTSEMSPETVVLKGFARKTPTATQTDLKLKAWGTAYYAYDADVPQVWTLNLGQGTPGRLLGATLLP